jgi:hypothetical protein
MLPALRYRGPLYCAPDVNRDNAHDPDRLVSDSGRMTGNVFTRMRRGSSLEKCVGHRKQRGRRFVFCKNRGHAFSMHVESGYCVSEHRIKDYRCIRKGFSQFRGGLETVHDRHRQIENNEPRSVAARQVYRLVAILSFTDAESVEGEFFAELMANSGAIVNNEDGFSGTTFRCHRRRVADAATLRPTHISVYSELLTRHEHLAIAENFGDCWRQFRR